MIQKSLTSTLFFFVLLTTLFNPALRFYWSRERDVDVKITKGKAVAISYDLTVDGHLIKCISAQKPLRYTDGKKQILLGLEKRLRGLKVGDRRELDLPAKEGYGLENPKSIMEVEKSKYPKGNHVVGKQILSKKDRTFLATVKAVNQQTLILNFNHPLAGKKLHFSVVVLTVQ